MSPTWNGSPPPEVARPSVFGWVRVALRAVALVTLTYFGMIFVLLFNLIERVLPLGIAHQIIRLWGTICLWLCGIRYVRVGRPMAHHGAVVANHSSWIDIFTLLRSDGVYFVSKAEVGRWPAVGWLSRQIGTVYIERRRTEAKNHENQLSTRLRSGDRMCFFPEGTSTDGQRVVPFRTTLFQAFMAEDVRDQIWVQPVTVRYIAPDGQDPRFYSWWGDMALSPHIRDVFARAKGGRVEVIHHPALPASAFLDRKALAAACEAAIRHGLETGLQFPGNAGDGGDRAVGV